jgi:hypothetical protein
MRLNQCKGPLAIIIGYGIIGYGVSGTQNGLFKVSPASGRNYGSGATERNGNVHFGSGRSGGQRVEHYYDSNGRLMRKTTSYKTR